MKTIDLLVEELPKRGGWPEKVTHIGQDYDHELMFYGRGNVRTGIILDQLAVDHRKCGEAGVKITREQYEAALAAKNDGWIEWGGGKCPLHNGAIVDVKLRNGRTEYSQKALSAEGYASYPFWRNDGAGGDIIAYRLHQPQQAEQPEESEEDLNECIGQAVAAAWNGEGLPPVGCECERSWAGDKFLPCKIVFTSNQLVVVKIKGSGIEDAYYIGDVTFRPLRSEADKKRDAAIESIDWYMPEFIPDTPNELYHAKKIYDAIAAGKIPGVKLED